MAMPTICWENVQLLAKQGDTLILSPTIVLLPAKIINKIIL